MGETVLSHLPIHPVTGLQALGSTRRGPIWPVMGGSQPQGEPQQQATAAAPQAPPTPPGAPSPAGMPQRVPEQAGRQPGIDFPEKTAVSDMTLEQQIAYFRYHDNRKGEQLRQLGDITPEQIQQLQSRNQELEDANSTASEKSVREAQKAGRAEAEAEWRPKYQTAMLKATASQILSGDQLNAFIALADASKFAGADGEIDEQMVMTHLTALYPGGTPPAQNGSQQPQQQPNWGQHGGPPPAHPPGEAGRAEAERRKARQGIKT